LLSSGLIVSGELLRMTAPRAAAVLAAPIAAARAKAEPAVRVEPALEPAPLLAPDPASVSEPLPEMTVQLTEIEQLAAMLRAAGTAAHKVTILGTAAGESITLTALTLARQLGSDARVVLVDLAASSPMISAISVDPFAPGLAELMQGEASFSQVITRDGQSRVHLVSAGRPGFDRVQLQSPRMTLAIDALLRVYDHVLLDAGTASDLPAELLTAEARAVVVPEATMTQDARALMCEQLKSVGFSDVMMLDQPASTEAAEAGPRVAA
jgi:polysaccharide biosynthesis transport protein